ncbi:MAG: MFS transporter [Gemmataceae bacterium]
MDLRQSLRALAHRNFRLFFLGQSVSLIGTWVQQLAMSWLVYELTHQSPFWLGFVGFLGQVPTLFLAPFVGVWVDRWNRHRLIIVTQTLAMLQAFALAALTWFGAGPGRPYGVVEVWHVVALSLFIGVVNAFDMTARQAFLTEMVRDRQDVANAVALNSSMVNGARLAGPAVAAALLASTGAAVCFLVNGLSYLAVLAALLAMRVEPRTAPQQNPHFWRGLREGLAYAGGFAPVRAILLLAALVSLTGLAHTVLLPVFATDVFRGGAGTLGMLTASSGVGALAAAVALAVRRSVLGLGRWVAACPAVLGLALIGFSFAGRLSAALPLLAAAGFALMAGLASMNTILQTLVPEDKRGRVMSLYMMCFMGVAPVGSLLSGWLAEHVGAPVTLRIQAAACLAGSAAFAVALPRLRAIVRPVYVSLGILPEVGSGVFVPVAPAAAPHAAEGQPVGGVAVTERGMTA